MGRHRPVLVEVPGSLVDRVYVFRVSPPGTGGFDTVFYHMKEKL